MFNRHKQKSNFQTDIKHIAFIMDGNGRWAKKRILTRSQGHKAGVDRINEIFRHCFFDYKIPNVSLFVFSSENWKRSDKEISFLFDLLEEYFTKNIQTFIDDDVKINIVGDLLDSRIPSKTLNILNESMKKTELCKSGTFNILFNYGGQQDILQACKKIANLYKENKIDLNSLTPDMFNNYLYTKTLPNVDLLVRTSGEKRISNCYLFQLAYSELSFPTTYWPDFDSKELVKVIHEYNTRERRFGGIKEDE